MKLIFSRKGFDSTTGGIPSPIIRDGENRSLYSFPITNYDQNDYGLHFNSINWNRKDLSKIFEDLAHIAKDREKPKHHLDPDLREEALPRLAGWLPCFGQAGGPQTHLASHGVGKGSLFLFFGWFKEVEQKSEKWQYVKGAPDLHVLWGWLFVGKTIKVGDGKDLPEKFQYHPHLRNARKNYYKNGDNTLYVAAKDLGKIGLPWLPGGGVFKKYDEKLVLTWPGESRSIWKLPKAFYPISPAKALTFHNNVDYRWKMKEGFARLRTVGRGQEFMLDCAHYPREAMDWVKRILRKAETK